MRRVLLALAVLLIASASPALAGYIIIRVVLEGGGGGPSEGMKPGVGGMAGPMIGPMPGGMKPGGKMGTMGPPGLGGAMPNPFEGGNFGQPGGPPASAAGEDDPSRSVVVVVPLEGEFLRRRLDPKKTYPNPMDNPVYREVSVPLYGTSLRASLFVDSSTIQLYEQAIGKPAPGKTVATEVFARYDRWQHDKQDPQLLYDAMLAALHAGIVREPVPVLGGKQAPDAMRMAQELLDLAAAKKLTLPPDVARFVGAWEKVSKEMKPALAPSAEAEAWKSRLDANATRLIDRYAVIYWDRETGEDEVARRGKQLNENFAGFFLWHATRGVALPVPEKPLLAVLARHGQAMHPLQHALDGLPAQTDAFFSPDHGLLVLSPEPMDTVSQTVLRQDQQLFNKGYSRTGLLNRQVPKLDHTGEKGARPEEVARAGTLALVEKLMLNGSEVAAVSHEGSRQLMFATGVLPRHVTLPNWLTAGAVNAFTRPRGPAFVTVGDDDKPFMSVAFATGYGVPNYVLQRYFNEMGDRYHKELNADPVKLLENVLTDAYFSGVKNGDDPDPAPPKKPKKRDRVATANPMGVVGPKPGGGQGYGVGPMPGGKPGASPYTVGPMPGGMPGGSPYPGASGPGGKPGFGSSMVPPAGLTGGPAPGVGAMPGMGAMGAAALAVEEEDPAVTLRKKRARLSIKANATAWALYYYLANARPDELKAYLAELNKLPRDLPIDGRTARDAFVRVFDLAATKGGPADPARVKQFAKQWLDYIATVPIAGFDIPIETPEPKKGTQGGPGGPKYPMGPMPGGNPDEGP